MMRHSADPLAALKLRRVQHAEPRHAGQAPGGSLAVAEFLVVLIGDDTLSCKRWVGGMAVGDLVLVAKPAELQKSEYDGATLTDPIEGGDLSFSYTSPQERTVTRGDETEDQRIVPWYVPNVSRIAAIRLPTSAGPTPCAWMDLNTAARAWMKKVGD